MRSVFLDEDRNSVLHHDAKVRTRYHAVPRNTKGKNAWNLPTVLPKLSDLTRTSTLSPGSLFRARSVPLTVAYPFHNLKSSCGNICDISWNSTLSISLSRQNNSLQADTPRGCHSPKSSRLFMRPPPPCSIGSVQRRWGFSGQRDPASARSEDCNSGSVCPPRVLPPTMAQDSHH